MFRKFRFLLALLTVFSFVLTASAQERAARGERGERGEKADRGERREKREEPAGKRIVDIEGVISEVGEASISYQVEVKGKVKDAMIGIADVTRVEKIQWQPVKIKDLQVGDKAIITIYEDPEDPYFPALSVRVTGKGEVKKAKGRD